jgi:signal transduction histidine kinase
VDLRLGALRNRLRTHAPDEAAAVETAMDAVNGASVRLRHLLFELETPVLDAALSDGLRDTAAQLFEDSGIAWSVDERGRGDLPVQVRVSAYRIAREAMVNALKHARARRVAVTVDATDRGVEVHVLDDGRGMATTATVGSGRRHSGVVGMRDRALASGGWWRSGPGPGGVGTDVSFFLPVAGVDLGSGPSGALAVEQTSDDLGGAGDADHEMAQHGPAEQGGKVAGRTSFEQVGRPAGGQHARPRGGVRLR